MERQHHTKNVRRRKEIHLKGKRRQKHELRTVRRLLADPHLPMSQCGPLIAYEAELEDELWQGRRG